MRFLLPGTHEAAQPSERHRRGPTGAPAGGEARAARGALAGAGALTARADVAPAAGVVGAAPAAPAAELLAVRGGGVDGGGSSASARAGRRRGGDRPPWRRALYRGQPGSIGAPASSSATRFPPALRERRSRDRPRRSASSPTRSPSGSNPHPPAGRFRTEGTPRRSPPPPRRRAKRPPPRRAARAARRAIPPSREKQTEASMLSLAPHARPVLHRPVTPHKCTPWSRGRPLEKPASATFRVGADTICL